MLQDYPTHVKSINPYLQKVHKMKRKTEFILNIF